MIRRLLYRFRRRVLVWRLSRIQRRIDDALHRGKTYRHLLEPHLITNVKIMRLDATEMSKGEAYVVVR